MLRATRIDTTFGEIGKARNDLPDAAFDDGDRLSGGNFSLELALPLDEVIEPIIEGEHRRAGDQDAGNDRDEYFLPRADQNEASDRYHSILMQPS